MNLSLFAKFCFRYGATPLLYLTFGQNFSHYFWLEKGKNVGHDG